MRKYKVGQRIKIDFQNDYHNTHVTTIAEIISVTENNSIKAIIPCETALRIERKLCGMKDCCCGVFRGDQTITSTGEIIHIEEPADWWNLKPMVITTTTKADWDKEYGIN